MPEPVTSPLARTYRPGKFQDAPWLDERKIKKALERSGEFVGPRPRLNTWHERYAFPFVSQATDVSPPACQYSREPFGKLLPPPVENDIGIVESFRVRPLSVE